MIVSSLSVELDIIGKYHDHLFSINPFLTKIDSMRTIHGGGFLYEHKGNYDFSPLKRLSSTFYMKYSDIENYNLETICIELFNLVIDQMDKILQTMYEGIIQATQLTGNIVNIKNRELAGDVVLDVLEKLKLSFDEDGALILPVYHVGKEMFKFIQNLEFTDAQKKRNAMIIENKKVEWYAKKRYRKLSYFD